MYPWGRKSPNPLPWVPMDVPLGPIFPESVAKGAGRCTPGAESPRIRSQGCRWMYPWGRKSPNPLPKVLTDVPSVPKSAGSVAKGAGGCTPGAESPRIRCQGCRRMDPWGRKSPNPLPRVPADVPLVPKSHRIRCQGCRQMYPWRQSSVVISDQLIQ